MVAAVARMWLHLVEEDLAVSALLRCMRTWFADLEAPRIRR
jgi:hypothetical protein